MADSGDLFVPHPAGGWTRRREAALAGGLVRAYVNTPEHLKHLGSQFYPMWHADAEHFAQHAGISVQQGASVLAHLSPSQEAEMNRLSAYHVVHGLSDKQGDILIKAAGRASEGKSLSTQMYHMRKRGEEGSSAYQQMSQEREGIYGEVKRLRTKAGISGTALGTQSSHSLSNAIRTLRGEIPPMESLGNVKIRDFGEAIANPSHSRFPIDTHFHDAVLNRLDIPYAQSRGLSARGRYEDFERVGQHGHQLTQQHLGEEMPISSWMGSIWYGHQQRKVEANPDALRARKASTTKTEGVLNRIQTSGAKHLLPETYGMRPVSTKIDVGQVSGR